MKSLCVCWEKKEYVWIRALRCVFVLPFCPRKIYDSLPCYPSGLSCSRSGPGYTAEWTTGATLLNAAFEDDATWWLVALFEEENPRLLLVHNWTCSRKSKNKKRNEEQDSGFTLPTLTVTKIRDDNDILPAITINNKEKMEV